MADDASKEWLEALASLIEREGADVAHQMLETLFEEARRSGINAPFSPNTAYLNTIPPHLEERSPGDAELEWKIRALVRWNAIAMVVQANRQNAGIGGHIATYASAATLYETGFNHFFKGNESKHGGDLVYVQGHSSPGIYARAYLEGRLNEEQLHRFRLETGGDGLSSYPHPWLMPDFWQFPTVSMGLGPLTSIYQARFMRYMQDRELIDAPSEGHERKVWAFLGDGEMDEPESMGAIGVAGREKLDNLIFVINCNLQRLDGPVRGNGKIIQELEGEFRGSGWNVIKVVWGSAWDSMLARDQTGRLKERMAELTDGDYQAYAARGGKYAREHFCNDEPVLLDLFAKLTDDDVHRKLNRGGHDPYKVYAAYAQAMAHKGQPTVILAKTIKGYGMGPAGQAKMTTHSMKDMDTDALRAFRDRYQLPIADDDIESAPFYKPADDAPEMVYLRECREALGGPLPARRNQVEILDTPPLSDFEKLLAGSKDKKVSTTMAFVRLIGALVKDKKIGERITPIVPDEARTFGMEGLFRQLGIYSHVGQLYEPEDKGQLAFYKEDSKGQILEEGISEAGAFSSWIAAATSYANHGVSMIPFYIYYSMFGFQRIGDFAWAAADSQARGFLLGGTAGRTTLNGEGLQHQDGHSHILASVIPTCRSYDPAFAYELTVIVQDGIKRMYGAPDSGSNTENIFYYITVENENYTHPAMEDAADANVTDNIVKGLYCVSGDDDAQVRLVGCGSILCGVIEAAKMLKDDWGISSQVFSATSFNELAREGMLLERAAQHGDERVEPHVSKLLSGSQPVISATDYMRALPEQVRGYVQAPFYTLGTDGFGRSDTRDALRRFFEVDKESIVCTALYGLAEAGVIDHAKVAEARKQYSLTDQGAPWLR